MDEINLLIKKVEEAMLMTNRSLTTIDGKCGLEVNEASSKLVEAMIHLEKAKQCVKANE